MRMSISSINSIIPLILLISDDSIFWILEYSHHILYAVHKCEIILFMENSMMFKVVIPDK